MNVQSVSGQQQGRLVFSNYSTEHGLGSPEVYCVMQDSKGYMWFGTDQGVSRYDGYNFYNFGRSDGLTSQVIFNVLEDSDQNIWISSMTGEVFLYRDGKLSPFLHNECILQYNKDYYSSKLLHIDSEGKAYFDLKYVGILSIDRHGNTQLFTSKKPYQYLIVPLKDVVLPAIIYKTQDIRLSPTPVPSDPDYFMPIGYYRNDSTVQTFYKTIHTFGAYSTFLLDTVKQTILISLMNNFIVVEGNKILAENPDFAQINNIEFTPNGEILCAMHNKAGLRKYANLDALIMNKYTVLLSDKFCSMVRYDNDGGMWVTTLENGIYYCKNPDLYIYDKYSGLSDDYIISLALAGKNKFFLGLRNGNIAHLDIEKSVCHEINYAQKYNQLPFDLIFDKVHNNLLCGGAWIDPKFESHKYTMTSVKNKKPVNIVKFGNMTGRGWIYGVNFNTLHKIDLNTYDHKLLTLEKDRNKIYAVHESKSGKLWIGRQTGLFYYENDSLNHFLEGHTVFNSRIEDLAELPDSAMVLGTKGFGLVILKKTSFYFITTENGLTSDFVNDLHIDQQGTLWVATHTGLNKLIFKGKDYTLERFTTANGLPANEIYKVASDSTKVWAATRKGLVCVSEIKNKDRNQKPVFTAFTVGGLTQAHMPDKIKFRDNDIFIEFHTVNYQQESRIPYRYRLKNDMAWTNTINPRVEFMALGHGQYNFEVQSQNIQGNWSNSAFARFSILAPWWLDWRVWVLLGLLIIIGVVVYVRFRLMHYRNQLKIRAEMAELERKAIQAQMNPHFLFNALNSIQSFIVEEDKVNASHYLNIFSSLIRKTLDFSVKKEICIDEILRFLSQYLSLEQLRFENKFDFRIETDPIIDKYETCLPPLLVQPLVENAVIHAFKGLKEKGIINVEFKTDENGCLYVIVCDNGKGINYSKKQNGHQSFGIESIRKRLEILDEGRGKYNLHIGNIDDGRGTIAILKTGIKIIPIHATKNLQSSHY